MDEHDALTVPRALARRAAAMRFANASSKNRSCRNRRNQKKDQGDDQHDDQMLGMRLHASFSGSGLNCSADLRLGAWRAIMRRTLQHLHRMKNTRKSPAVSPCQAEFRNAARRAFRRPANRYPRWQRLPPAAVRPGTERRSVEATIAPRGGLGSRSGLSRAEARRASLQEVLFGSPGGLEPAIVSGPERARGPRARRRHRPWRPF